MTRLCDAQKDGNESGKAQMRRSEATATGLRESNSKH